MSGAHSNFRRRRLNILVADLDQVYDLAVPDDRLVLGVKGSVSEYELSLFRQRSQEAIVAKAKHGELTFTLPAGLSWTPDGQIELHPDRDRERLESLATDLRSVWEAPSSEMRVKQRIARVLIHEIVANTDDHTREIVLVIHWVGGRHAEVRMPRPKAGEHRHRTGPDAEGVVHRMAGAWPDHDIAATLNRLHLRTGAGNTWTASRVSSLRRRLGLVDCDATRTPPVLTLNQAADRLGVGPWVLRRLITPGLLEATQVVSCAPWQINPSVLDTPTIREAALEVQRRTCRPGSRVADSDTLVIPWL